MHTTYNANTTYNVIHIAMYDCSDIYPCPYKRYPTQIGWIIGNNYTAACACAHIQPPQSIGLGIGRTLREFQLEIPNVFCFI